MPLDEGLVGVLHGLVLIAAGLLIPAGVAKLRRPELTASALGLPGGRPVVRMSGAGELALAGVVVTVGGVAPSAALALVYAAFAVVATAQRRRGAACGCFGASTTPTSIAHVALDVAAAVVAAAAAITSAVPGAAELLAVARAPALALLVTVVVATATLQLALTRAPELAATVRIGARP